MSPCIYILHQEDSFQKLIVYRCYIIHQPYIRYTVPLNLSKHTFHLPLIFWSDFSRSPSENRTQFLNDLSALKYPLVPRCYPYRVIIWFHRVFLTKRLKEIKEYKR